MLARLKDETRQLHRDADVDRLSPLAAPRSVASYTGYLARIFGFEAPLEEELERAAEAMRLVDPPGWRRVEWIVEDLGILGIEPDRITALPRCPSIGPFESAADALAWLYVVERNAPMHGIVRRHFARRMPGQVAAASAYLGGTEMLSPRRWRALGAALDEIARTPREADRIVAAAEAAFRAQHHWLRHLPTAEVALAR
jgi:heme oxygenase